MSKTITYSEELARKIQNWGEQDPRINNAEMKRWRKKWAEPKDHRIGQEVILTLEIEDQGQDFIEIDVLKNGVILGDSVMFKDGRLTLIGVGALDGMPYHSFKEVEAGIKKKMRLSGLYIYFKNTGEKDPLPWKASTLKYKITGLKKAFKPRRFIK